MSTNVPATETKIRVLILGGQLTLHGIDRFYRRLSYMRQRPVVAASSELNPKAHET
jgi:hypothetical protein